MKNLVLTGATSMIGTALIDAALTRDETEHIYAVVRQGTSKKARIPGDARIHIVECDMHEYETLPELISGPCDVFYHFAWPRTDTYLEAYDDARNKDRGDFPQSGGGKGCP